MSETQTPREPDLIGQYPRTRSSLGHVPSVAAVDERGWIPLNIRSPFSGAVFILVTNECPVKCAHCVTHSGGKMRGHAEFSTIETVIRQARAAPEVKTILFSGGEPFAAYDRLQFGLELAKREGFETGILTSANWAVSPREARDLYEPLARFTDTLYVSVDVYHQRTISWECVRTALKTVIACGTTAVLLNPLTADEIHSNPRHQQAAFELAEELGIGLHAWPIMDVGRAMRLKLKRPQIAADQPCGIVSRPSILASGDVHACSYGITVFSNGHPLHCGNVAERPLGRMISDNSRNLMIQAIRALGPVQLLGLLDEAQDDWRSQCSACRHLCALPDVRQRLEAKIRERPELLRRILQNRMRSRDRNPRQHANGADAHE